MSQVAIREFDAKKLFAQYTKSHYSGYLIDIKCDNRADKFLTSDIAKTEKLLVVKPDMLFWKRGKHWLLWIKLTAKQVVDWVRKKSFSNTLLDKNSGILEVFLVEFFVPHTKEYYIAIKTEQTRDVVYFSENGGVSIEDNWDTVRAYYIPLMIEDTSTIFQWLDQDFVFLCQQLLAFFRLYGFTYLEINPFCKDTNGQIIALDMVAKVDDCEKHKQTEWKDIVWTKAFGAKDYPIEQEVRKLDAKTGASLKISILNPQGDIFLILWWWWASVITMDSLANAGFLDRVVNYGELSWNPDYDSNKAYITQILSMTKHSPASKQYLCMIGGIANFTRIDYLCEALVSVLQENMAIVKQKNIHIICRRGGVNDLEWIMLIKDFCSINSIPYYVFDTWTNLSDRIKVLDQ